MKKNSDAQKVKIYELAVSHVKSEIERSRTAHESFRKGEQGCDEVHKKRMMDFYYEKISTLFPIYFLYLLDQSEYQFSVKDYLIYGFDLPT